MAIFIDREQGVRILSHLEFYRGVSAMENRNQKSKTLTHLRELCESYPHRSVGSVGNSRATAYFDRESRKLGYETVLQEFDCIDWQSDALHLSTGDREYKALPSPWSLGCDCRAELLVISSLSELRNREIRDKLILLRGEIAREQLMPKNFPFYNPERDREIINLLEKGYPAAIITATTRNPELAGALYPFPLFEDGDFDIPSAYMTDSEGEELRKKAGETVHLRFQATRIPARGFNVLALKGNRMNKRIVISAHIDTKPDTPGALDNAAGVVIMLKMMEQLKNYQGPYYLEFLAMNGEDYYAASGEKTYLRENEGKLNEILCNINIDAAGFREVLTGYVALGDEQGILLNITASLQASPLFREMQPWYQGDHMVFVQNGIPALAITSENFEYLSREITHTEKDSIELLDIDMLDNTAITLAEELEKLS